MFDISDGDADLNDSTELAEQVVNGEADMYLEGSLDYALEGLGGTVTPGTTVGITLGGRAVFLFRDPTFSPSFRSATARPPL